jgi:hypothetical protein
VVSELDFSQVEKRRRRKSVDNLCEKVVVGRSNKWYSQVDCRRCWKCSQLQSDSSGLARRVGRRQKMATEGHNHGQDRGHQHKNSVEKDKELTEVRERMEKLAF